MICAIATISECEENLFRGVNTVQDAGNMTYLEEQHFPVITSPEWVRKGEEFEVTVEVGKLLAHPNEPGHFIEFIKLYADDKYLAKVDFTGENTSPVMKVWLTLNNVHSRLRAYAHCNLHGTWEGCHEIEVIE